MVYIGSHSFKYTGLVIQDVSASLLPYRFRRTVADRRRGLQHLGHLLCHHLVDWTCWMESITPEVLD